ncbi:MAG TPA: hypothetical protein VH834_19830 [Solirubrobacteraceae bacterium]
MSRIDALPADQKSVLQLLLRQGKGYDDLSGLLRLDVSEVRSRAHDALDALGPGAGGVPTPRRQEIGDWLLGQQGPDEAAATRAFLEGSPAGRSWAEAVASELKPLAGDGRLPEIPPNGVPSEPVAASAPSEPAPTSATSEPAPTSATSEPPAAPATPIAPAPTAAPRVSRRGGAALIGGAVAVIAAAVVLVLVLSGGDDKKSNAKNAADTTSTAATTQSQPKVQAQINLTPPQGAPAPKAAAIVQIVDVDGTEAVNAVSQGLKTSDKAAFAIWVYSSPSHAKLIGGFNKKDNNGHLVYQGALPDGFDITGYSKILVTRETSGSPKQPGAVYLSGDIPRSSGG